MPERPSILVSVAPYAYFVERIIGDEVAIQILVPPGANPHIYEPSPRQVEKAYKATVWFRLGEPSENKIFTALESHNQHMTVVDLTQGISLIGDSHEEGKDRHVWLSPKLAQKQVVVIAQTLTKIFPTLTQTIQEGLNSLLDDLVRLDKELAEKLEPYRGDAILVSHPAFGYFCQEFGLKQLSIEYEGKDPLPQDIVHTLEEARETHVKAVFTQVQYNNKGAELIAQKLDLPIYSVDPYALDYMENLRHLAALIAHD